MNIKAGDLVMVVRSHCPASLAEEGGLVFVALRVEPTRKYERLRCRQCGAQYNPGEACAEVEPNGWHPLSWLKKIDPLSSPEHIEQEIAA